MDLSGRGSVDNLFIIQQLAEKGRDKGEETHLPFIDLEKAYDHGMTQSEAYETVQASRLSPYRLCDVTLAGRYVCFL